MPLASPSLHGGESESRSWLQTQDRQRKDKMQTGKSSTRTAWLMPKQSQRTGSLPATGRPCAMSARIHSGWGAGGVSSMLPFRLSRTGSTSCQGSPASDRHQEQADIQPLEQDLILDGHDTTQQSHQQFVGIPPRAWQQRHTCLVHLGSPSPPVLQMV